MTRFRDRTGAPTSGSGTGENPAWVATVREEPHRVAGGWIGSADIPVH
jgi:hypothetical protein